MPFTINTPALLFPAITLLMLAYTNRFLGLATLIRNLHTRYKQVPEERSGTAHKKGTGGEDQMRKAKGVLTVIAGLVLLFQAGTTVAYADGGHHKTAAKSDNEAKVSTSIKSSNEASARASADAKAAADAKAKADAALKAKADADAKDRDQESLHVNPTSVNIRPLRRQRGQRTEIGRRPKGSQRRELGHGRRQADGHGQGQQAVSEAPARIDHPQCRKRVTDQLDQVRPQEHRRAL